MYVNVPHDNIKKTVSCNFVFCNETTFYIIKKLVFLNHILIKKKFHKHSKLKTNNILSKKKRYNALFLVKLYFYHFSLCTFF